MRDTGYSKYEVPKSLLLLHITFSVASFPPVTITEGSNGEKSKSLMADEWARMTGCCEGR